MLRMGIGAQRINLAAMLASSRVIALAAAPEHDQVLAEPGLVRVVAEQEPAAESLAIGQAAARARVIVRGAELGLAIVLAEALVLIIAPAEVRELVIVPAVVRELETGPVAAEPELEVGQVVEPVPNQPRAQLAVPPRTRSVTGPRRHDQVLLLMVEDLAVEVVETTRDPAVTEAAKAWAVAE
jgi:hypothetical protein